MNGMKDEKRLYILNSVVYIITVVAIYIALTGFPKDLQSILNALIDTKTLLRAALTAFGPSILIIILINNYFWRWHLFRKIFGIRIPCIHGRWEGHILSKHTEHKVKHKIAVEFWQTLQKIKVWYYDENAITHSLIADFSIDTEGGPMWVYCVYRNQPIRTYDSGLQPHNGVMEMVVDMSSKQIRGTYYNNPFQRHTYGEMYLEFVDRKLRKQFRSNQ